MFNKKENQKGYWMRYLLKQTMLQTIVKVEKIYKEI